MIIISFRILLPIGLRRPTPVPNIPVKLGLTFSPELGHQLPAIFIIDGTAH